MHLVFSFQIVFEFMFVSSYFMGGFIKQMIPVLTDKKLFVKIVFFGISIVQLYGFIVQLYM